MKYPIICCVVSFYIVVFYACGVQKDPTEDALKLLQSNEIQRKAHLENNAQLLVGQIADSMRSVSRGEVRIASNHSIQARFEKYFSQVKYTSWDDIQAPAINISTDGQMAVVYVQKLLDLQYRDENGDLGGHHYALFAWNAEYEKIENTWKITANTSTDKTLTETEAFELPIHLSEAYAVIPEKDLIPEGVAYDNTSGITFLSSTYKQKILAIRSDGSYYDFKGEGEDGLWSTVGMEVDEKHKRLWVVSFSGNEVLPMKYPNPGSDWTSRIHAYHLPQGELMGIYQPEIEGRFAFNDVCVDTAGVVYISESLGNRVYRLNPENASFEKLPIQDSVCVFPNGISLSDDNKYLYIASQKGILQYDFSTQKHALLQKPSGIVDIRLDGLAYYKGSLIGNQSFRNRIVQFVLDEDDQTITGQRILEANHPAFDQPATGEIADGHFIYLANAQMRSGFKHGKLRNEEELEAIKLLKVKLPN